MHVNESWRSNQVGCLYFRCARRQRDAAPRPNGFNDAVANQNGGIAQFPRRSVSAPGVQQCCGHKVLGELHRNGNRAAGKKRNGQELNSAHRERDVLKASYFAMEMLASFRLSPSTLPLTVT